MSKDIDIKIIGHVRHDKDKVPRHWSISDLEGQIIIDKTLALGLKDIEPSQKIAVIFHFHKSEPFIVPDHLTQIPPCIKKKRGVFSTCSPLRPSPLGLSVLEVIEIKENIIRVKGIDMLNGTPVLDIKPYYGAEKQ